VACGSAGCWERAQDLLHQYLRLRPAPTTLPAAYYQMGRCSEALGDTDGARAAWRRAVEFGIVSREAVLAHQALETIAR